MKKNLTFSKTSKLKLSLCTTALLISIITVSAVNRYQRHLRKRTAPISHLKIVSWNEKENLKTSATPFGNEGVFVFDNLFFHKKNYLVSDANTSVNPEEILNPNAEYAYQIKSCQSHNLGEIKQAEQTKKLEGTTIIFSASRLFRRMQDHYFHFCEELILALNALGDTDPNDVKNILFPNKEHWEERYRKINAQIFKSFFPNAQIINESQFEKISKNSLLKFDRAIFVDRHACHKSIVASKYNKMCMGHFDLISPNSIKTLRNNIYTHLKTYPKTNQKPYITYVMRSSYRYLEPEFEKKLLDKIQKQFPQYTLNPVKFELYSFPEQLQIIRNTKVLIGAHGNGLTHELFLPDNALVIEIFPKGAFCMDYQHFAELAKLNYFAVSSDGEVISKAGNHMPPRGEVNQVITEFDTSLITNLISDYTSLAEGSALKETSLKE